MRFAIVLLLLLVPACAVSLTQVLTGIGSLDIISQISEEEFQIMNLSRPLIILEPNQPDALEAAVMETLKSQLSGNPLITFTKTSSFDFNSSWHKTNNLVVVGGPEHSSTAHQLFSQGIYNYIPNETEQPKLVAQYEQYQNATILLLASVYSYRPGPSPLGLGERRTTATDKSTAVAVSVVVTTLASIGVSAATTGTTAAGGFLGDVWDFLKGGLQAYLEDLVEAIEERFKKKEKKE